MSEYSTGDHSFKLKIHNEKEVTPEFVLNEAKEMWVFCRKEIRARKLKFGDTDGAEKLMADMRKDHKDFCTSYPVVLRYMVEMQTFHPDAFKKYLKKIAEHPWKNEDEYLDSQADYIVLLYKATHKRWNATEVSKVRTNVRAILQQEHDQYKKYEAEFKQEVEADETRFQEQSKNELADFLRTLKGRDVAVADEFAKVVEETKSVPDLAEPVIIAEINEIVDTINADDLLADNIAETTN